MGTGAVQRLQDLEFRLNMQCSNAYNFHQCSMDSVSISEMNARECTFVHPMFWWQFQCPIIWWSQKYAEAIWPVPRCRLLFAWRRVASTTFPENLPRTSRTQALNCYQSGCNWVFQWLPYSVLLAFLPLNREALWEVFCKRDGAD